MSAKLTRKFIKLLCGRIAYDRGEAYYRHKKVDLSPVGQDGQQFHAVVHDIDTCFVHIDLSAKGNVAAQCSCDVYSTLHNYCKHIAAVLLAIFDDQEHKETEIEHESGIESSAISASPSRPDSSGKDVWLTRDLIGLFDPRSHRRKLAEVRFDSRSRLQVEFILRPCAYRNHRQLLAVELKLGVSRPYIVKNILAFLDLVDRGQSFSFTPQFAYDPEKHSFDPQDYEIIRELIAISKNEQIYSGVVPSSSIPARRRQEERLMVLPPYAWNRLLSLFMNTSSVKVEDRKGGTLPLELSYHPLPLHFEVRPSEDHGSLLVIHGLEELDLYADYGLIRYENAFIRLEEEDCKRLAEMKGMMEASRRDYVHVPGEQMEPFMRRVVPGLAKLGKLQVAEEVSNRIKVTPLKAKLYLDRLRERLLAGLEFHYGNVVLNPLESAEQQRGTEHILLRNDEQERLILELMEGSGFTRTESAYYLDKEEAEYDFLVHMLPRLEQMVEVYATSAVKVRVKPAPVPPKVTLALGERTDWLELTFRMDGISEQEIREVMQALEARRKYYRLPDGALMPLESAEFQHLVQLMNDAGPFLPSEKNGASFKLPVARGLQVIEEERYGGLIQLEGDIGAMITLLRHPEEMQVQIPLGLAPVLRDYQQLGFKWMSMLASFGFGGVLADDMGLGKTLQSIAFLVSRLDEIRSERLPALIVAPASLVYNWRNELVRFAPDIRCTIIDGAKPDRVRLLRDLEENDVLITSYPLLRMDVELFADSAFHTLILDEAQSFKNYATQTAKAVKMLQARYRFALTGTPIENSLDELWSIYDAVFPALFQSRARFNDLPRERIAQMIRPFMLRRLKTDVLKELPEKIESLQSSALLPEQKKLYAAMLAQLQQDTLKHLNDDSFEKNRIQILAGITRLRQLCCHPALFVEGYQDSSAKYEQLLEIIEEALSAGKRMLIFSQFTEMLGLIGRELGYRGIPFFYLDGKTPPEERVTLCSRFNEGENDVFLISLKAGGTGLNLTGADTVILYDLWWNPAVEQQAADRAHRMGQKRVVHVLRLVAENTVEQKMYELQQKKMHLIDEVLHPDEASWSSLNEQDIRDILSL